MLGILAAALAGYLVGSTPTGVLVCRLLGAPDPRHHGSGHTGGLNTLRQAGFWAGVITTFADIGLGYCGVALGRWISPHPWAIALAGVGVVAGHNWSLWLGFKGGIGLAKLAGAVLAAGAIPALIAVPALAILWVFLMKVVRVHRARATIGVVPLSIPFLWWLGMPWPGLVIAAFGGLLVTLKTLPDWNRVYPESESHELDE